MNFHSDLKETLNQGNTFGPEEENNEENNDENEDDIEMEDEDGIENIYIVEEEEEEKDVDSENSDEYQPRKKVKLGR